MRGLVVLGAVLAAAYGAACARASGPKPLPPPTPVTVQHSVAYEHEAEEVRRAYAAAMRERGLAAVVDSSGDVIAVVSSGSGSGTVRVDIRPSDTLTTRVTISYRYERAGSAFIHYPYELSSGIWKHLDRRLRAASLPQSRIPSASGACPEPTPVDSADRVVPPMLAQGSAAFHQRARYPEEARAAGVEGVVYLSTVVDEGGNPTCIDVLSGLPHGLTDSAVRLLASTRFIPAQRNGHAIASRVVQPVKFLLFD